MPPKNENKYAWLTLKWQDQPDVTFRTNGDKIEIEDRLGDRIKQMLNDKYGHGWKTPFTCNPELDEYIKRDLEVTNAICNHIKKEKEEMDKRTIMHKLQKEMYVEVFPSMVKGYVKAFDYTHFKVGIRPENQPSYIDTLLWVDPGCITIVKNPTKPKPTYIFPKPRKVIHDPEAGVTVVLWEDGDKTIVRAAEGEQADIYDAFCAAFCKRIYGTNSKLKRELNKVLEVKEKK